MLDFQKKQLNCAFQTTNTAHFTSLVVIVKSLMSSLQSTLDKAEAFWLQIGDYDAQLKQVLLLPPASEG